MRSDSAGMTKPNWELLAALRFVLALLVCVVHLSLAIGDGTHDAYFRFAGSTSAVMVFLIVSGFSISNSFAREPDGFYRRRFWRIVPVFWLALLMAMWPFWLHGSHFSVDFFTSLDAPTLSQGVKQFLFLQPALAHPPDTNQALWSMGVEEAFYAVTPLIARLPSRVLGGLCAASAGLLIAFPLAHTTGHAWLVYSQVFWCFGAGVLYFRHRGVKWACLSLTLAPAAIILAANRHLPDAGPLVALGGCSLIANMERIQLTARLKAGASYLGDLSYPLYATHFPIAWLVTLAWWDVQFISVLPA